MTDNQLFFGDNLEILRLHIKDESVDLVYLDPPFKSNVTYNVLFEERNGSNSAAQIKAFEDTWRWDQSSASAFEEIVEAGGHVSQALQAFRLFLGENDMMAYLAMMAPRLVELRRVLKPTGSIYLHCDPTASAYLRLLMDAIFSRENFVNEVIWAYRGIGGRAGSYFERKHDILLFFRRSQSQYFEIQRGALAESTQKRYGPYFDGNGQITYRRLKKTNPGVFAKLKGIPSNLNEVWLDKAAGPPLPDWWIDISPLKRGFSEHMGYPTQKPEALLERIISASSRKGDVVLDPFCGCGTTISVAQHLKRRWIGIDVTHLAIMLIKHRLQDAFGDQARYKVIGEPVALPGAKALAKQDPYQFQWWALGLVGARPADQKKGADKGIDGQLYFHDEGEHGKTKQIIISVKAGKTSVAHLRDLRGVINREKAAMGVLISMERPTKPMRAEAASAGFYESPGWRKKYPRLQLLTIAELLKGKGIDYPPRTSVTFKRAKRSEKKVDQRDLGLK